MGLKWIDELFLLAFGGDKSSGSGRRTGSSKYFIAASCDALRADARALNRLASALHVMKTGALLAKDHKVVTEIQEMIDALNHVEKDIRRAADDNDPREEHFRPQEPST